MTIDDVVVILLSIILFKFVTHGILLCKLKSIHKLNHEIDLLSLMEERFLKKVDSKFGNRWVPPIVLTGTSFLLLPFVQWELLDHSGLLRFYIMSISAVVAWEAITNDLDLGTEKPLYSERIVLFSSWIALFFYPGFLLIFLFVAIHFMRSWHNHQMLQLQILLMFITYIVVMLLFKFSLMLVFPTRTVDVGLEAPLFLILSMVSTIYVRSGLSKIRLGKHWYSWAMQNHLNYIVMSSYMWGWRRTDSKEKRIAFSRLVKKLEKPLQFGVLLFECSWFFGGFDRHFTEGLFLCGILFHLMVFAFSGLFFWQPILNNLFLFILIINLPVTISTALFNPLSGLLFAGIQLFDCFVKNLWEQLAIGWWDTPFISKIHWEVIGRSGKRYGLYNDFMRPHEWFFGRHHSLVLYPQTVLSNQINLEVIRCP